MFKKTFRNLGMVLRNSAQPPVTFGLRVATRQKNNNFIMCISN